MPKSKVKPKAKIAKKPDAKPASVIQAIPDDAGLPTTEQLALIAATLAKNSNARDFWPWVLTKQAMELWESAQDTIYWAGIDDRYRLKEKIRQATKDDLLKFFKPSDKYPVTREAFLKRMLPKKQSRLNKLVQFGKEFCRERLRDVNFYEKKRTSIEPTQDEVDAAYNNWGPFQTHQGAATMALRFEAWHTEYTTNRRIDAGKCNAARLKKRNKRKVLT